MFHIPYLDHAWHIFSVVLTENAFVDRNRMIELLAEDGIGSSVHYKPLHRMSYYQQYYELKPEDFPNTEKIWRGCFSLPIYSLLLLDDAKFVVERIKHHLKF